MRKKTKLLTGILVVFTLIFTVIARFYSNDLYSLKVNVSKYSQQNIPKNSGIKKQLLQLTHFIASAVPGSKTIEVLRGANEIGYGSYNPPVLDFHKTRNVNTNEGILKALAEADPGVDIVIAPGVYELNHQKISFGHSGTELAPIRLRALKENTVVLKLVGLEGFYISKQNWVIENLVIEGACDLDNQCQHALHIVGNADNLIIQNNHFKNFNAHIKSNGSTEGEEGVRKFPDNVKVLHNSFTNDWPRLTAYPVTPIDVVGGDNWVVKNNFIADFSKLRGNNVAYGAFLKGGGKNGSFEENLVACEWMVPHTSALDVRIGLSLGGGGTSQSHCQSDGCVYEHMNGKLSSNTIVNCGNDVGIYLNKAKNTRLTNNLLLNTLGVDARFDSTSVLMQENIIQGRVRTRNGAHVENYNTNYLSIFDNLIE